MKTPGRAPALAWSLLAGLGLAAVAPAAWAAAGANAQQMVDDLGRSYPPGSIVTPQNADRALSDARAVHSRLQAEFDEQRRKCASVFFVNRCLDTARRAQRSGEHVVRAVTLEAHDLQRHRDAQAHVESRAQALRDQATEDLQRPERERQAALSARTREQNASAREADEQRDLQRAAEDSAAAQARANAHVADVARKDAARPKQEAASLEEYQDKQKQAVDYARTRALDREANAKRRAERDKARAADAAANPPRKPATGTSVPN